MRKNPPERALARENLRDTSHAGAEPRGSRPHELAAHGEGVFLVLDACRRVHERGAEPVHVIGTALDGHEALAAKPHVVHFQFAHVGLHVDFFDGCQLEQFAALVHMRPHALLQVTLDDHRAVRFAAHHRARELVAHRLEFRQGLRELGLLYAKVGQLPVCLGLLNFAAVVLLLGH